MKTVEFYPVTPPGGTQALIRGEYYKVGIGKRIFRWDGFQWVQTFSATEREVQSAARKFAKAERFAARLFEPVGDSLEDAEAFIDGRFYRRSARGGYRLWSSGQCCWRSANKGIITDEQFKAARKVFKKYKAPPRPAVERKLNISPPAGTQAMINGIAYKTDKRKRHIYRWNSLIERWVDDEKTITMTQFDVACGRYRKAARAVMALFEGCAYA